MGAILAPIYSLISPTGGEAALLAKTLTSMCINPILAAYNSYRNKSGKFGLHFNPNFDDYFFGRLVSVPCGKCIGCQEDRVNRWINRLRLELDNVGFGTFITLTYANAPESPSKSDLQRFIKRLRHAKRDYGCNIDERFKYFAVAEHGGERGRVHYHALLFGVNMFEPEWLPRLAIYKDDKPVFTSGVLERIWKKGFVTIGDLNSSTCKYISKYMFKQDGQEDNFSLKSMRLGVGEFFDVKRQGRKVIYSYRYGDSLQRLHDGNIHVSDGGLLKNIRIPPSILRYCERISPDDYDSVKASRVSQAEHFAKQNFDYSAYVARIKDERTKTKRKRILH